MLTLDQLRSLRIAHDLKRTHLTSITGIDADRLRILELRQSEPWFDEAILLCRALGLGGILPLITPELSGTLTLSTVDAGLPTESDLPVWWSGARPPLSLACRIAVAFGLDDPCRLSVGPIERQIWEVLEANERTPQATGWCPWCGVYRSPENISGQADHLPTCLPGNLWSPHTHVHVGVVMLPARKAERRQGIPAKGLKALREDRHMIQKEVAAVLGVHPNYYARLERGAVPLTADHAATLASHYNVDRAVLYALPVTLPDA